MIRIQIPNCSPSYMQSMLLQESVSALHTQVLLPIRYQVDGLHPDLPATPGQLASSGQSRVAPHADEYEGLRFRVLTQEAQGGCILERLGNN